jgi:hypothetical protein
MTKPGKRKDMYGFFYMVACYIGSLFAAPHRRGSTETRRAYAYNYVYVEPVYRRTDPR